MKKYFWVLGLVTGLVLLFGYSGTASASVNDFTIKQFEVDYYLGIDQSGRSSLDTTEKIVAEFPSYGQNHGIERALVTTYDGHSTNLTIKSVKDQLGQDYGYTTSWQQDNLVLRIGDPDTYVHGEVTYLISYSQRDTTKFFADTNSDEFYWDINGDQWSQSFDNVTARLHLEESIINKTNGKMACYYGVYGASNKCDISDEKDGVITVSMDNLLPGENVTIAVGFLPGTFSGYQMDFSGFIDTYMAIISLGVSILGLLFVAVLWAVKGRSHPGRGIIVPEYLPPKDINVVVSSVVKSSPRTWVSAVIIDFAVRHKLKIIEKDKKKYALEFANLNGLDDVEQDVIKAFFGESPSGGQTYDINKRQTDFKLATKLTAVYKKARQVAKESGYYRDVNNLKLMIGVVVTLALLQALVISVISKPGITLMADVLPFIAIVIALLGYGILVVIKPLSEKGRELADYLDGLKKYIKVAEKDRIKILQSPIGSEKTPIDTNDQSLLIHLYEKVLPYAVLFGQEKNWTKVIGEYYESQNQNPDWYVGHSAFNAVIFSSVMSDFSSGVKSNSYYSSSSSSSGGSGGGGFSGGGGGGGGGGGW